MKYTKTILTMFFVGMFMIFSSSAILAQDTMKKDEMKKDDTMKKDEMMKKDDAMMKDDAMKKDDAMMKKDDAMMKKEDLRPIVAVIRADWCPYCKKVEPVISALMTDYSEKLRFVVFDVTNETTTAKAMKQAKELGLGDFFKDFKGKTSAVAVLKDKKVVYKTSNNGKRADYEKAFDQALK